MTLNRITQLRIESGLTQEDFAAKIGKSKRVVGSWERGESSISLDDALLVSNFFDVPIDQLADAGNHVCEYEVNLNDISAKIREAMETKGIKQADLFRMTGFSRGKISYVVSGSVKDPRVSTIVPIALALNISLDELLVGSYASNNDDDVSEIVTYFKALNDEEKQALIAIAKIMSGK